MTALALLGQVAYLDALYWRTLGFGGITYDGTQPALLSAVVTGAVVSVFAGGLAIVMAYRGGGRHGARPLGLAFSAWAYLLAYSGLVVLFTPDLTSPWRIPFEAHFLVVEALGMAGLIRFTLLFPEPARASDFADPATLRYGLGTLQRARLLLLSPPTTWVVILAGVGGATFANELLGRSVQDTALLPLVDLMRLAGLALVVMNIRSAYLAADAGGRRRMLWIAVGFGALMGAIGILLGGNVLAAVTGWELPGLNWRPIVLDIGVIGLMLGAAMGVYYEGDLEPRRIARRGSIALGMAVAALFFASGLETLLSGGVSASVALPDGIGTAVAILIVGFVYTRTHRPLETVLSNAWADLRSVVDAH